MCCTVYADSYSNLLLHLSIPLILSRTLLNSTYLPILKLDYYLFHLSEAWLLPSFRSLFPTPIILVKLVCYSLLFISSSSIAHHRSMSTLHLQSSYLHSYVLQLFHPHVISNNLIYTSQLPYLCCLSINYLVSDVCPMISTSVLTDCSLYFYSGYSIDSKLTYLVVNRSLCIYRGIYAKLLSFIPSLSFTSLSFT